MLHMEKDIIEEEIDLRDYLNVIWKSKSLILSITLASLILSASFTFIVQQKEYQTDSLIYVKNLPADLSNAERYSSPMVIASTITSNELLSKTAERSGLDEIEPFKSSRMPKESAVDWLNNNIRVSTKDTLKGKLNDKQIEVTLTGTLEPEMLQKVLQTHIDVIREANKKMLTQDAQSDIDKIDVLSASLVEQRTSALKAIERIPEVNSSDRTTMLELFITLNSRLTSIEDRLNAMQISKKNLEFLKSQDFSWIEIMSSPYKPENPVGPRRMLNVGIAGVLGLFVGVMAAFFKNYMEV